LLWTLLALVAAAIRLDAKTLLPQKIPALVYREL